MPTTGTDQAAAIGSAPSSEAGYFSRLFGRSRLPSRQHSESLDAPLLTSHRIEEPGDQGTHYTL